MTDQEKHFEENKEPSKISEDHPNSLFVQNPPKENSLHSILLSVAFYLSIIYLVLFVSLFGLYLLSIILAFDPDWEIFRIAPLCLGILDLIGTLLVKEEKSY